MFQQLDLFHAQSFEFVFSMSIFYRSSRSKTLNYHFTKTTYPTDLEFTELIKQVNESQYTNFQSMI